MDRRQSYILFNMIDGLGPVKVRALLDAFREPQDVFQALGEKLQSVPGIGKELAGRIVAQKETKDPVAEEEKAASLGIRIVTQIDDEYPRRLKEIHDPPLALYVKGRLNPEDDRAIAVVGSRQLSHYGESTTDRLSFQLAEAGCTVVSGLARGIDTIAHTAALKAKGRTLAVIGSAHDKLYPPENADLAEHIAKSGAVISEYPFGRVADRATFPYRNRIVSGLSLGVLVIEAPVKSGSLITADSALEQGRQVFAVPGRIDQKGSKGCHRLIKQGAKLVEEVNDIFEEFEYLNPVQVDAKPETQSELPFTVSDEERMICELLEEDEMDADTLARTSGLSVTTLSTVLMSMEMKKMIRVLPGRRIALNRGR